MSAWIDRGALDRVCSIHGETVGLRRPAEDADPSEWIDAYRLAVSVMEEELWSGDLNDETLDLYQQLFRELEAHYAAQRRAGGEDERHRFVIVIPVADRPQHLSTCLESLLTLCRLYGYGGMANGRYRKVSVVVVDDSKSCKSLTQHRAIAERLNREGLDTHYLSQEEQQALVDDLDESTRSQLTGVLSDGKTYQHKGASITRNIAYLKLAKLAQEDARTLFYFIDSDQEFRVNVDTPAGERRPYALNYLHHLDRLFREKGATFLTGKVVGDPPVAPAVMAGNFLDDVIDFLLRAAPLAANAPCGFHGDTGQKADDAAYHDMADLFGYQPKSEAYRYRCTLTGDHDHRACLTDFARKLSHFFDGEHPTRKSGYQPAPLDETVVAARTIYTGNYLFTAEGLDWFIPFATLKLRMAGPVLGRILKAELGERFISANLPMLHGRTVESIGQSEFRPGIEREGKAIDLSGEFERQYFGDVMLFTMEHLTAEGFPQKELEESTVAETIETVEGEMYDKYLSKRTTTAEKIERLRNLFDDPERWWHQGDELAEARDRFQRFMENMERNFGSDSRAYALIQSDEQRTTKKAAILDALLRYRSDRDTWRSVLKNNP